MHYKDRVSAFMCTNAPGTDKVDMTIIGKAKNPRCFKGRKCPLTFFSQAKTWADNVTYRKRCKQVFLRHIWRTPHRQELSLMDGCSSHEDLEDDRGKPKAMVYLPNCTSVRRPMDQGISAATNQCALQEKAARRQVVKHDRGFDTTCRGQGARDDSRHSRVG